MKRMFVSLILLIFAITPSFSQKIGLLLDSYLSDRWYVDQKFIVDRIQELGGECIVEIPYGDPVEQLRLGKKLIASKVDALIIVATDTKKAVEIVDEAKKA